MKRKTAQIENKHTSNCDYIPIASTPSVNVKLWHDSLHIDIPHNYPTGRVVISEKNPRIDSVKAAFLEAAHLAGFVTQEQQIQVLDDLKKSISYPTPRVLWSDKAARKGRNPAQFIREEYAEELKSGLLSSPILLKMDPNLYTAYKSWIKNSRHPEDNLNLSGRVYNKLHLLDENALKNHQKEQQRIASGSYRKKNWGPAKKHV